MRMTLDNLAAGEAPPAARLSRIARSVAALRADALALEQELDADLRRTAAPQRGSAGNLAHYLAVRRHDIRRLQRELGELGLSSLGRMEAHVLATLDAVLCALGRMERPAVAEARGPAAPISFGAGEAVLAGHAEATLGPAPGERKTRIMVTLPGEAAAEPSLIRDLLVSGMNIARINCAHDDRESWARMIAFLRQAEQETGRACKLCFDLAGPKLRTGPMEADEGVLKWHPRKNRLGQVVAPAVVRLVDELPGAAPKAGEVPVRGDFLARAETGDRIEFEDARSRRRSLEVIETGPGFCVGRTLRAAYVTEDTGLLLRRRKSIVARGAVGTLPLQEQAILLRPGDALDVMKGEAPGRNALLDDGGKVVEPAQIGCALEAVFRGARRGERIFFDDGRIEGRIRSVAPKRIRVDIVNVAGGKARLRGEKGINLPDSSLQLPALSGKDLEDLGFVAAQADLVALSFVQSARDIEDLLAALRRLDATHVGIVLKIETRQAFARLPHLLLTALRHPSVAVMVARGDLGVEVGFERLSEVQEEILWLCEAAHIPVIWATQVLESLAKGGIPSRAEVTDAAMSARAECVMLNKGPYILQAMSFLCDVLNRMESHHEKKTAMLRRLSVSELREEPPASGGGRRRGDARRVA